MFSMIVLPALVNFRLDIFARILNLDWLSQFPRTIGIMRGDEDTGTIDTILGHDSGMVKLMVIFIPNELVILVFTIWNKI